MSEVPEKFARLIGDRCVMVSCRLIANSGAVFNCFHWWPQLNRHIDRRDTPRPHSYNEVATPQPLAISRPRSARPRAIEVNSLPVRIFSAPKVRANILRTIGTNDDPPVRKTLSIESGRTSAAASTRSTHSAMNAARAQSSSRMPRASRVFQSTPNGREAKPGRVRIGECELGLLDRFKQQIAEIVFDDLDERANFLRLQRLMLEVAQLVHGIRRLEERQEVPALHLCIKPGRHRQHLSVWGPILGAAPEFCRNQAPHDFAVERVAGDRDPVVGEDLVTIVRERGVRRAQPHDGEVAGAAAEIGDQDQLFTRDGRA